MGIIQKQATRSTLINFIGIGFGSITRFVMPFVLEQAQIGILLILDSISKVFIVILNFGYNLILRKLFPKYRDEKNGHAGFLALGLIISLVGSFIGIVMFFLLKDSYFGDKLSGNSLIRPFIFLIPILMFFRILFMNLDGYVRMLFKTVIGSFLEGFVSKIIFLLSLILYLYTTVDFEYFVYLYCFALITPGLVILFYAFFITKKITLPSTELMKEHGAIKYYILFGALTGASGAIVQYIDVLMLEKIIPINAEDEIGVYSFFFFAAALIIIPHRGIAKISAVVVAESWKGNDLKNLQSIYEKSALNMLIIGGYLFIVGWACLDSALEFEKLQSYAYGKYVFFFLGVGKLIELSTGVNSEIISASEKYKYNTYFNFLLAILAIVLNLYFISDYGILGAAFATLIAVAIINLLRGLFLYKAYKLIPFNKAFFKALIVVLIFIAISFALNYNINPILEIAINFSLITLLYWVVIIKLNISSDINTWLLKLKTRFIK